MTITKTFKTPILTTIYRSIGWVVIVLGVICAIIILKDGTKNTVANSMMSFPPVSIAIIDLLITFAIALPLFGIAQVVEYIGKTAFYAELANSNLISEAVDVKKALGKVSDQLKKIADNQANAPTSPPPPIPTTSLKPKTSASKPLIAPSIVCPHCRERILESNLVEGMNTCPKCSRDFKVEC